MPDEPAGGVRGGTPNINGTPDNGSQGLTPATFHRPRRGDAVVPFHNNGSVDFADACRRHHQGHDRDWWCHNFSTIILIGGGYYAWDSGWWYPAYGYDPSHSIVKARQEGLRSVLFKPFRIDQLLTALESPEEEPGTEKQTEVVQA